MRKFLGMTVEEWQSKYEFLCFQEYCYECGKEADEKHKWENNLSYTCFCDDCKLMWDIHPWK